MVIPKLSPIPRYALLIMLMILLLGLGRLLVSSSYFRASIQGLEPAPTGLTQGGVRWRNDDGTETSATFRATEDTSSSASTINTSRLRFMATNQSASSLSPVFGLQYASKGGGECSAVVESAWVPVPASAVSNEHWQLSTTSNVSDGTATTNVSSGLQDPDSGTFVAGEVRTVTPRLSAIALAQNNFTELEYGIKPTVSAVENSQYCFRLLNAAATPVRESAVSSGVGTIWTGLLDTANDFGYYSTTQSPGKIAKIRLSDMTAIGNITLESGENVLRSGVIDTTNGFAYYGTGTSPAIIVKIRLSDFTRVGAITLQSGENDVRGAVIDINNGFAYFGTRTDPGIIVKIRLSDFSRVGSLPLDTGEGKLNAAVIDTANGVAYFGTSNDPAKIIKVRLSDFTKVGTLIMEAGETATGSMAMDTTNSLLYLGTSTSPAIIVKMQLSNFTRLGALTLNSGENLATGLSVDAVNQFLYAATLTSPSRIVKVNLADFSRVSTLTLNTGENSVVNSPFDPASGYTYYGSGTSPTFIIKVDVRNRLDTYARYAVAAVDNTAPTFAVSYNLGVNNPTLNAGTYTLTLTATDSSALAAAPSITIDAEGTVNDVSSISTVSVGGNVYTYQRVISFEPQAAGSAVENISITGSDIALNTSTNVDPTNETTQAARTALVGPRRAEESPPLSGAELESTTSTSQAPELQSLEKDSQPPSTDQLEEPLSELQTLERMESLIEEIRFAESATSTVSPFVAAKRGISKKVIGELLKEKLPEKSHQLTQVADAFSPHRPELIREQAVLAKVITLYMEPLFPSLKEHITAAKQVEKLNTAPDGWYKGYLELTGMKPQSASASVSTSHLRQALEFIVTMVKGLLKDSVF